MTINCNGKLIDLTIPKVMGILNLTPDSFFDGGRFLKIDAILSHVEKMIREGADFIDIGASSTRPGAKPVLEEEELSRLAEPVKQIRSTFPELYISIDTYHSGIARTMVHDFGVDMINDISAGLSDEAMFETIADLNVPYIMMHMQGTPQTMQQDPQYKDVVKDVLKFLSERQEQLNLLGANDIIADPGFGFGKQLEHNLVLFRHLEEFSYFDLPILVGVSRKSMISAVLDVPLEERMPASIAMAGLAIWLGASIIRAHDVQATVDAVKMIAAIKLQKGNCEA